MWKTGLRKRREKQEIKRTRQCKAGRGGKGGGGKKHKKQGQDRTMMALVKGKEETPNVLKPGCKVTERTEGLASVRVDAGQKAFDQRKKRSMPVGCDQNGAEGRGWGRVFRRKKNKLRFEKIAVQHTTEVGKNRWGALVFHLIAKGLWHSQNDLEKKTKGVGMEHPSDQHAGGQKTPLKKVWLKNVNLSLRDVTWY